MLRKNHNKMSRNCPRPAIKPLAKAYRNTRFQMPGIQPQKPKLFLGVQKFHYYRFYYYFPLCGKKQYQLLQHKIKWQKVHDKDVDNMYHESI